MKFVEDLKPLKLYSSATKVFIPINEKNKRHGSVVSILANDKKTVVDAMTNPIFVNQHYFNSYYADGDVTAIINHENAIDSTVSESVLFKTPCTSNYPNISFDSGSFSHIDMASKVINGNTIIELQQKLGNKVHVEDTIHVNIFNEMPDQDATDHHHIAIVKPIEYDDVRNGPYDLYLKHEVARMLILNINPNVNNYITTYVAMAISGQLEYFKNRNEDDVYISGAIIVDQILKTKGPNEIVNMIKKNDLSLMAKYASKSWLQKIEKTFE